MRKLPTKALTTAAVALALSVAALAAGCGEKSEDVTPGNPQPFDVALDFYVNADHAGLYVAIERGYFRDAGLDVRPRVPSDPSAPIKEVAAGRVDLAISYEPEVLLARDQGLPVKAVAAVVPTPLTSLIWLQGSGIRKVKDLRGKTVATAGIPYQEAYLADDPRALRPDHRRRRPGQRPAGALAGHPLRARRRDARRLPERRGRGSEAAWQGADRDPGRQARHPHLRGAGAGRQLGSPRGREAEHPAVHRGAGARHEGGRRPTRPRRPRRCSTPARA